MAAPNAKLAEARETGTPATGRSWWRGIFEARGISDPLVLAAMGKVPREAFVPEPLTEFAYEDFAAPHRGRPDHLAALYRRPHDRAAELEPGDKVLEVGAGSGYAAAVLSRIAEQGLRHRAPRGARQPGARAPEAARLRQCRDHLRRRHQGTARPGAVRRHHRLGRRPESAGDAEAAARHRRDVW